jgi:hypothetical protein
MFLVCVAIMVSLTTGNSFLLSIWLFPDRPCSAKVYVFFCKKNSTFAKRNTDNPPFLLLCFLHYHCIVHFVSKIITEVHLSIPNNVAKLSFQLLGIS